MLIGFFEYAQTYYRTADGELSEEYHHNRRVAGMLRSAVGSQLAKDVGPKRMKMIREEMVAKGWTRNFINDQFQRLVRMFRWAASEEMIPASVSDAMKTIEGLRKGRSKAKESKIVHPVDDADVESTIEHLPQVVADMVAVQRLTGCRPGELCIMRPCDINKSGPVWLFQPAKHKTEHHGHSRTIAIGPKAQFILLRYLARGAEDYCFQPRDSEAKRRAAVSADRITPLNCGNRLGAKRVEQPLRKPGECYSVDSYRRAITRAAKKANVAHWTPHRLRHTAATEVRKEFGLDAAQSVLGHRNASVTQIYAELHADRAAEVAAKIG